MFTLLNPYHCGQLSDPIFTCIFLIKCFTLLMKSCLMWLCNVNGWDSVLKFSLHQSLVTITDFLPSLFSLSRICDGIGAVKLFSFYWRSCSFHVFSAQTRWLLLPLVSGLTPVHYNLCPLAPDKEKKKILKGCWAMITAEFWSRHVSDTWYEQ